MIVIVIKTIFSSMALKFSLPLCAGLAAYRHAGLAIYKLKM